MNTAETARQRVNRLTEEIAKLSEQEFGPAEYYGEFLQRILAILEAPAGAVWVRTPQGNLQLQHQINMQQVGLDRAENGRQMHDELLRQVAMKGKPGIVPPRSSAGEKGPGNPTDLFILLAPIIHDKQVAGIIEVWHQPMREPDQFLQFLVRMAALASGYTRNHQLRQMVGQQQVWVQLEVFARQIHGSLNPTEVSYQVANEARRLSEADRISVAVRTERKPKVTAISGADVVEKRSNLVQLMRRLFEEVMLWGERLVYSGSKDESLPPAVNRALDLYLAESNSKMLVVMPLKDERESKSKNPPRSALMMECFEPAANAEQMLARLEVIGRHATPALYNAAEHYRMPFRFIWLPLATVQEGLGGKTKAIVSLIGIALVLLVLAMIFVPYPLKMEATGQLVPTDRRFVYPMNGGRVTAINGTFRSGDFVDAGQILFTMRDKDLATQITNLLAEKQKAELARKIQGDDQNARLERAKAESDYYAKSAELDALRQLTNSNPNRLGEFFVRAPIEGIILTPEFRETLNDRYVKPSEQMLRIGKVNRDQAKRTARDWEIELKIPQKHFGQVKEALLRLPAGAELDVDLIVRTSPTSTYKAKLSLDKIASQATPNKEDASDSEAVVLAWARLSGDGIAESDEVPAGLLLSTVEVHCKIRCGDHAMGYSLFYGVWEFIYEKVIFWF
jgi:hypothetical protein